MSTPEGDDFEYAEMFAQEVDAIEHTFKQFSSLLRQQEGHDTDFNFNPVGSNPVTNAYSFEKFSSLFSDEMDALETTLNMFSVIVKEGGVGEDRILPRCAHVSMPMKSLETEDYYADEEENDDDCKSIKAYSITSFESESGEADLPDLLMKPLDKIFRQLNSESDKDNRLVDHDDSIDAASANGTVSSIGSIEKEMNPIRQGETAPDDCTINTLRMIYKKKTIPEAIMNIIGLRPEPLKNEFGRLLDDLEPQNEPAGTEANDISTMDMQDTFQDEEIKDKESMNKCVLELHKSVSQSGTVQTESSKSSSSECASEEIELQLVTASHQSGNQDTAGFGSTAKHSVLLVIKNGFDVQAASSAVPSESFSVDAKKPCMEECGSARTTQPTDSENEMPAVMATFRIDTKFDLDDEEDITAALQDTRTPKMANGLHEGSIMNSIVHSQHDESAFSNHFSFYESIVWNHWPFFSSHCHYDTAVSQNDEEQSQVIGPPMELQLQSDTGLSTISGSCSFLENINRRLLLPEAAENHPDLMYVFNSWDNGFESNEETLPQQPPGRFELQQDTDLSTISGSYIHAHMVSHSPLIKPMDMPHDHGIEVQVAGSDEDETKSSTCEDLLHAGRKVFSPLSQYNGINKTVDAMIAEKSLFPSAVCFGQQPKTKGMVGNEPSIGNVSSVSNVSSAKSPLSSNQAKQLVQQTLMVDQLLLEQSLCSASTNQSGYTSGMSDSLFHSVTTKLVQTSKRIFNSIIMPSEQVVS